MEEVKDKHEKSFFRDNEGILIISSDPMEKEDIENGLNKEITKINNVKDLVNVSDSLLIDGEVNASVIITKEIPKNIRLNMEDLIKFLEVAKVPVFEIGLEKKEQLLKDSYQYNTVLDFLNFARNQKRKSRIGDVKDKEHKTILEELQMETEYKTDQINDLNKRIEGLESEKKDLGNKYESLKKEIEMVHKVERDEAIQDRNDLKEDYDNLKIEFNASKKKNEIFNKEKEDALDRSTQLATNVESYKLAYKEKVDEIKKLKSEVNSLKNELKREGEKINDLLNSRVDSDVHQRLNKELEKVKEEKEELKKDLAKKEIEKNKEKFEKEYLNQNIRELEEGELDLKNIGRTLNVDRYTFENVDVVYIKVFEDLPYFKKAVKMFFDKVSERYLGLSHLMVLKNDEGIDTQYFSDLPLKSKMKDIEEDERIVRMYPNPSIFVGTEEWEKDVGFLLVVDYIKNNEYYVQTKSREKVMTLVRRETDIDEYNLKGSPITIEGKTVYDISYDKRIYESRTRDNRDNLLSLKVDKWVEKVFSER